MIRDMRRRAKSNRKSSLATSRADCAVAIKLPQEPKRKAPPIHYFTRQVTSRSLRRACRDASGSAGWARSHHRSKQAHGQTSDTHHHQRHARRRQSEQHPAGPRGPVLLEDFLLFEKLAHQNRERIPERGQHAKGSGAYGTLTVTNDIARYTKAKALSQIGTKTEAFLRFSTVAGERGAADAERDVRGFALRFYTEEGNWDIVGNNTPIFFVRDPLKFPDFIHTQKRHPRTNMRSPTAMWDFWS